MSKSYWSDSTTCGAIGCGVIALLLLFLFTHGVGFACFWAAWTYIAVPYFSAPAAPWYAVYGVYVLLLGVLNAIGNIGKREVKP